MQCRTLCTLSLKTLVNYSIIGGNDQFDVRDEPHLHGVKLLPRIIGPLNSSTKFNYWYPYTLCKHVLYMEAYMSSNSIMKPSQVSPESPEMKMIVYERLQRVTFTGTYA